MYNSMYPLMDKIKLDRVLARIPNTAELLELVNRFKMARLEVNRQDEALKYLQNRQYSKVQSILITY